MTDLHPTIAAVTDRIIARSAQRRAAFLDLMNRQREAGTNRGNLSCGNLAHGFAASGEDKPVIRTGAAMNIGIVTAYNDMLSAHQPYGRSEEHTSELQSLMRISYAVVCLIKKKPTKYI